MRVVAHHRATVTERAEVLGRIEAEAAERSEPAGAHTIRLGAVRLRAVLDQRDRAPVKRRPKLAHRRQPAVQMGDDDRPGARREGGLKRWRCHGEGRLLHVGVDRTRTAGDDGERSVHGRIGDRDHLVTGPDAGGAQGELQGIRAAGDADAMADAAVRGELALEGGDLAPEHVGAARQHASEGGLERIGRRSERTGDIVERNTHRGIGPVQGRTGRRSVAPGRGTPGGRACRCCREPSRRPPPRRHSQSLRIAP